MGHTVTHYSFHNEIIFLLVASRFEVSRVKGGYKEMER